MGWLQTLVLLLGGAASAASLNESLNRGADRRREKHELKRGLISPRDAARELEHRIGGRVAIGRDHGGQKLVIMRAGRPGKVPREFAGYRVEVHQEVETFDPAY